ncbi:MAG: eL32 family ribosomal protein [Candidatus Pacearchaeota archaeon]
MAKRKFLRRTSSLHLKLGRKRKKKQVWRKPTGRHNKMRERRKGYPVIVSIGYRTEKKSRGEINNKKPVRIMNIKDLEKLGKENIAIIGKIGMRKKTEIIKIAKERNIEIANKYFGKIMEKEKKAKANITSEEARKIIEDAENKKTGGNKK